MIKYLLILVLALLSAGGCSGGSSDSADPQSFNNVLFTDLEIQVKGSEIYTESERIDAFIVIDMYWTLTKDCV